MSHIWAYVRGRTRAKGVLNILSALSRMYFGGKGSTLLSDIARLNQLYRKPSNPSVITIETMAGCNYRCSFCPIGKMVLPEGRMQLELYTRILGQLAVYTGEIHLFFKNEPLLDERLPVLARMAAEKTRGRVVIQTNGSKLTVELARILTPYARIIVNDYTRNRVVSKRIRSFPKDINNLVLIGRNPDATLTNRAGNHPNLPSKRLTNFCIRPFNEMFIDHRGKVVLCCQDWGSDAIVGDMNTDSIEDVWKGRMLEQHRKALLNRTRNGICAKCDFPGV